MKETLYETSVEKRKYKGITTSTEQNNEILSNKLFGDKFDLSLRFHYFFMFNSKKEYLIKSGTRYRM